MDYFAWPRYLPMDETHVCVLDREDVVVRESKAESTAQAVANELSKAPSCRSHRIRRRGRMAPILFHGLNQLGLPVVTRREPSKLGVDWSRFCVSAISESEARSRGVRPPHSGFPIAFDALRDALFAFCITPKLVENSC